MSAYDMSRLDWLVTGLQAAVADPFEKSPVMSGETIIGEVTECLRRECSLHARLKSQRDAETDPVVREAIEIKMATVDTLRRGTYHELSTQLGQPITGRHIRRGGVIVKERYNPKK